MEWAAEEYAVVAPRTASPCSCAQRGPVGVILRDCEKLKKTLEVVIGYLSCGHRGLGYFGPGMVKPEFGRGILE